MRFSLMSKNESFLTIFIPHKKILVISKKDNQIQNIKLFPVWHLSELKNVSEPFKNFQIEDMKIEGWKKKYFSGNNEEKSSNSEKNARKWYYTFFSFFFPESINLNEKNFSIFCRFLFLLLIPFFVLFFQFILKSQWWGFICGFIPVAFLYFLHWRIEKNERIELIVNDYKNILKACFTGIGANIIYGILRTYFNLY